MSYHTDPVHQTVRWLRSAKRGPDSFAVAVAERWAKWARIEPEVLETHVGRIDYEPYRHARVMVDITFRPGRAASRPVTLNLSLHVFAEPEAARREVERAASLDLRPGFGPPLLHFPERNITGWTLPNAPELEELAELLEPVRFRALLERVNGFACASRTAPPHLLRYVPLRRALLVWHDPVRDERYWLKLLHPKDAAAKALGWREIAAWYEHGAFGARLPRLVHYWPDIHTLLLSEVRGRPIIGVLRRDATGPMLRLGQALAELHDVPTRPGRERSPAGERARLAQSMAELCRALPALQRRVGRLLDRLTLQSAEDKAGSVPIHGGLDCNNVLFGPSSADSRSIDILDWCGWCYGDRHADLGSLIAHLVHLVQTGELKRETAAAAAAALVDGYGAAAGPRAVNGQRLAWQTTRALLMRAHAAMAQLAPAWPHQVVLLLAEAERVAAGDRILARSTLPAEHPAPQHPELIDERRAAI